MLPRHPLLPRSPSLPRPPLLVPSPAAARAQGADTVIYERLARGHPTNEAMSGVTLRHMENFGSAGLRTLCLSFRQLDAAEYDQ